MIPSLSQEELTQYASDAQTIQQPQGADYSQGVKAGRTIPAKWWNWLFSASTKRIIQSRTDANNILTELKNVVTDAGLTPTASDNTQLEQAVVAKANTQIDNFVARKQGYFLKWTETTAPAVPSGWRSSLITKSSGYTNAMGVFDDNCACIIAYQEGSGSLRNTFKASVNGDGKGWSPLVDVHLTYAIVPTYNYHAVAHKFRGRYFLYIDGTCDGSWQDSHAGEMFVSDDLKTWTSMFTISYERSSQAASSNGEYPAFGWSNSALYVMSKEGVSTTGQFATKLRACYDGYSWETIVSDFEYPAGTGSRFKVPNNNQKVIPVGENGFLWGDYVFDGTNFGPVISTTGTFPSNCNLTGNNPCIFASGKVLYPSTNSSYCFIAPYPGAQAVAVELSASLITNRVGRIVLGHKYIAYGSDYNNMYTANTGGIKLLDDTGTVTTFNHPPRAEGATEDYIPFELNGVTYCGKYKTTTDFEHWEMVQDLPEGTSSSAYLFDCADPSLLGFYDPVYDSVLHGYKSFIGRNGTRWQQAETTSMHRGSILFTDCCWNCAPYPNTNGEVTYNSDNRVIGHTLYLR